MKNRCTYENPAARLFVGLCPVAAGASCGINGLAIGMVMLIVLLVGGLILSAMKKHLPEKAQLPSSVLILCMLTVVVQMFLRLIQPELAAELDVFVPMCAVGAVLSLLPEDGNDRSAFRGAECGAAALAALTLLGALRELLGSGSVFGAVLWENTDAYVLLAHFPAGAYILLGMALGIVTAIRNREKEDAK